MPGITCMIITTVILTFIIMIMVTATGVVQKLKCENQMKSNILDIRYFAYSPLS